VSVVANVAINLDARGVTERLKAIRQTSIGAADGFTKLSARAQAVKSIVEAQQGSFAKASTVQGVFAAKVKNTEFAIKAQIAALRDVQSKVQLNGALYQKAAAQIAQYEATLVKTTATQDRSQKSLGGLRGALASIGAGALVAGMVRGAAAAEQLQLRLKLLSREYGETERVQQFVAQSAKTFGQSQVEAAAGVADVYARLRPLGTSLAEIETVYKGFNAVALASGTSAEAASGAFLQLSQALGSGRLQGDEFRSIAEQVPGILKLVANEMGVTVGQLKQLGSEGKITSDVLINALAKGFEENKGKISELLALSPAQRFKEFKDSTQALSNAMGSELLPAIVPVVKVATELLKVFGQLPGPMKTIIAAAIGLTAAFVALAPAISTVIGLLTAAQLAALVAAGPWIALAAGITAAAVALASYRTESEKIGAKAAAGDPAAMSAARGRMVTLEQEIALMKLEGAEKASPRSALGGSFANAKAEFARLKRDVTTGQTAAATPTPTPTPTPTTGTGTGKGAKKGKDDAARIAEQIRASKLQLTLAQDIFAIEGRLQQAQLEGNKQLVLARNAQKELAQIASQRADIIANKEMPALEKKNVLDKLAIDAATVSGKLGFDLAKIEQDRTKSFDEIIADLDLQLKLKTATTEQEREQLRIAAERAKLEAQLKGLPQPQIDQAIALQAQVAAPLTDVQKIDQHIGKLKTEITDLTSISNIAITAAEGIGNAFAQSFQGLISGTMTAKEALGSFFKSVADMFLEMAAQIIAKQITMIILQTILKALGAVGGGGGNAASALGSNPNVAAYAPLAKGGTFGNGVAAFAKGGTFSNSIVSSPTLFKFADGGTTRTGLMGEAGPEAIMPLKRGSDGSLGVQASGLREAMGAAPGSTGGGAPVLNMSFQSSTINGVEYVSRDQLEAAMAQTRRDASRDGAKRGMTMTLDKLQQSPSTRSRVGMR
jgi:lambda family phage tail tape measure protein